jgi:hypothetical protein
MPLPLLSHALANLARLDHVRLAVLNTRYVLHPEAHCLDAQAGAGRALHLGIAESITHACP